MNINEIQLYYMFESIAKTFSERADELCSMDAKLGDGDLGLTMKKGFAVVSSALAESDEHDLGKKIMKAGMKMASAVPSTMGTLMSSGIVAGGKKLIGKESIGASEMADYLQGFAEGIVKRGKCNPGDRTVLDSVGRAAESAAALVAGKPEATIVEVIFTAYEAALAGVEATKYMEPKFGKAAVHRADCSGLVDQGALAGVYMLDAMKSYILEWGE